MNRSPFNGGRFNAFGTGIVVNLRASIAAAILADSACAGVVAGRVRPGRPAQKDVLPTIRYKVISNPRVHHLGGPAGVSRARVELTTFAKTEAQAFAGALALRNLFDGYFGVLSGVTILECSLDDESDGNEISDDGTDQGTYEIPLDFFFSYRESIPAH